MYLRKSLGNFTDQITFNGNTKLDLEYRMPESDQLSLTKIAVSTRVDGDHSASCNLYGCDEVGIEKIGHMFLDLAKEIKIKKLERT